MLQPVYPFFQPVLLAKKSPSRGLDGALSCRVDARRNLKMHSDFNAQDEIARARAALFSIPPDLPHDEWVKVGMAAHSAGLSFDDFDTWCAQAGPPIYSPADCASTWRSFDDNPGGIGPGTLFFMAKQHGWRDDGAKPPQKRPIEAHNRPAKPQSKPARAMSAAEVWDSLQPILPTDSHPYILAKQAGGVPVGNLRIVPPDAHVLRLQPAVAGCLAVPVFNAAGALQSLQFIPPPGQGKKLNLRFSAITGGRHVVGEIVPGCPVYLCEGIATCWAVWQGTGHAAVCCFGWGNVATIARQLRQDNPGLSLVICPDVGKEAAAQAIAREVGAALVYMPQDKGENYDCSNYAHDFGVTELQALLESPHEPPPETTSTSEAQDETSDRQQAEENPPAPRIKPVSVFDVLTNPSPPPAFVWGELVPRGEVTVFAAHGGVGKSTVALMLCDAVATGMPLFGIPTQQARALFVSAEDGAPIVRHRLAAIARGRGANPTDWGDALQAVDITASPELYESDGRSAGATTAVFADIAGLLRGGGFGLVVIDNASDVYGGDEIQRRPVRTFLRHLKQLASENNCAVLLLVHVDKATSRNKGATGGEAYSGSTAWHNTARSRLFLSRDDSGMLKLEHLKSNFGRMQAPLLLQWPDGGLPMLAEGVAADFSGLMAQAQGRNDDNAAAALLKLIAEFESRGQFAAPAPQARNNVHALLRSESAFKALGLTQDDTKRIVNQCQRAGWIAPLEYRTSDRKNRERWTVTEAGRAFAGLFAPTAPTAPTY